MRRRPWRAATASGGQSPLREPARLRPPVAPPPQGAPSAAPGVAVKSTQRKLTGQPPHHHSKAATLTLAACLSSRPANHAWRFGCWPQRIRRSRRQGPHGTLPAPNTARNHEGLEMAAPRSRHVDHRGRGPAAPPPAPGDRQLPPVGAGHRGARGAHSPAYHVQRPTVPVQNRRQRRDGVAAVGEAKRGGRARGEGREGQTASRSKQPRLPAGGRHERGKGASRRAIGRWECATVDGGWLLLGRGRQAVWCAATRRAPPLPVLNARQWATA